MTTKIEWTHIPGTKGVSWNTIGGCTKKPPECDHCYACRDSYRIMHNPKRPDRYEGVTTLDTDGKPRWTGCVNLDWDAVEKPFHWRKRRTVFVVSMADLFHVQVPSEFIAKMFWAMLNNTDHTYLVLTKRARRMRSWFSNRLGRGSSKGRDQGIHLHVYGTNFDWPVKNVWLGVTAGTQESANERVPLLLRIPAWIRWVSYEPALEYVDFTRWLPMREIQQGLKRLGLGQPMLDWIVGGGESRGREMDPAWLRQVRDDCGAPDGHTRFFVKQMAGQTKAERQAIPDDLMIREWPLVA